MLKSADEVHAALVREARAAESTGSPLPGELDLVSRLGCTRQQVRTALADLEQRGVLRRRQGAVTTVDPVGLRLYARLEEQEDYGHLLARLGHAVRVEVLEAQVVFLPPEVARLLGAPAGSPALHRVKRFCADDRPLVLVRGHLLLPREAPAVLDESTSAAVVQAWGEPLIWEVSTPGACAATSEDAGLLDLAPGAAVMTLDHVGITASGRRVFASVELHAPGTPRLSFLRTKRFPGDPT